MKNLILLFTLVFVFGFTQTIQAQPVPGDVVNETQVEKPKKPQKTTCERPRKGTVKKASMKKGNAKKSCCKGQAKGKAANAKYQSKYGKNSKSGYNKTAKKSTGKRASCKRKAYTYNKPIEGKN